MKQLLEDKVLQMLPVPKGLVVAVATEVTEDNKMVVEYRMISAETNEIQRVSKNVFLLVKFGPIHKRAEMQVKNHISANTAMLENGRILVVEEDSSAMILSDDGLTEWIGTVSFNGEVPSAVAFDGKSVWAAYEENNTLVRLNSKTLREELRIGNKEGNNKFRGPAHMFAEEGVLYISNKSSKQVWKINTSSFEAQEYLKLETPIYGFAHFEHKDIVWLEDGIYEI